MLRDAMDAGAATARDPQPVLLDTLESLALLDAAGDVLAAAILHVAPALAEAVAPKLAKAHPTVVALLEGQQAATQVWALHAERHARGAGSEEIGRAHV